MFKWLIFFIAMWISIFSIYFTSEYVVPKILNLFMDKKLKVEEFWVVFIVCLLIGLAVSSITTIGLMIIDLLPAVIGLGMVLIVAIILMVFSKIRESK